MEKIKIYEISTQHVEAFIPIGSTTMKFVELNGLRDIIKEKVSRLQNKKAKGKVKSDIIMELLDLLIALDDREVSNVNLAAWNVALNKAKKTTTKTTTKKKTTTKTTTKKKGRRK